MTRAATKLVAEWFATPGWTPAPFQRRAWRAYLRGQSGLIHAPTGTGKTHAAWMGPIIEALHERGHGQTRAEPGADGIRVLWLTPLRALATDTVRSLAEPLDALGLPWTVEKRTGDVSSSVKARQRKRLPTALVTTPESLSLLLSYADVRRQLASLRCVVVDEWHELMGSKRGIQTELCLAHLRSIAPTPGSLRTWGCSATLGNLDEAMAVLMGNASAGFVSNPSPTRTDRQRGGHHTAGRRGAPNDQALLITAPQRKRIEVATLIPDTIERLPWAGHLGTKLVEAVCDELDQPGSALMFTNTRSQCELWFEAITQARPGWLGQVAMHHGSIDRSTRDQVETLLRDGALRCVVCTSSLDLGVDFSPVDRVLQVGSPKGIGRLMQRAGRSGHQPGKPSRVIGVPTHAFELVEFAAAREAVKAGNVEPRVPLKMATDVLTQHLVTLAVGGGFEADVTLAEVRSTHAFAELTDAQWQWALDFVTRGGPCLQAYPRFNKVRIVEDPDGRRRYVADDRGIVRMHRMMIGTITADASMRVAYANGKTLGTVEENFIAHLKPGQRFLFAGKVLELVRVREMTATVRPSRKRTRGAVPRWQGGRSPLSTMLARGVRAKIDEARRGNFRGTEMRAARPVLELQSAWSILPAPDELLIETTDSRLGHHAFVFSFQGRLVHEGLSTLVAYRLSQTRPISVTATANDYGFELLSDQPVQLDAAAWRTLLSPENLTDDLTAALGASQLARRRFRAIAQVAGLVFPGYPGQPKTNRQLQASSELFYDVFSEFEPNHALLDQAKREVLDNELELTRMRSALVWLQTQAIRLLSPEHLTPLAFPLWAGRIRESHVTSEDWRARVEKMAAELEAKAAKEDR